MKLENNLIDTTEIIVLATNKYNKSIHSVTNEKPIDILHSKSAEFEAEISKKIQQAQEKTLEHVNKDRTHKTYQVGDPESKQTTGE